LWTTIRFAIAIYPSLCPRAFIIPLKPLWMSKWNTAPAGVHSGPWERPAGRIRSLSPVGFAPPKIVGPISLRQGSA
jgi:hypothetical protein